MNDCFQGLNKGKSETNDGLLMADSCFTTGQHPTPFYHKHEDHLKKMVADYKAEVVDKDAVYDLEMDIYAPCALSATLNDITIPKLKCAVVAGAANNQLHDEGKHGMMLLDKGIVYAPDFLINAGGLINVYSELQGYNREKALEATRHIYNVTSEILKKPKTEKISTVNAAKQIAEQRIRDKKNQ